MNRKLNQQDFNLIQQGLMDNAMKQHQQQKEETPKELFTGGEWQVSEDGNDIEASFDGAAISGICSMYAYENSCNDAILIAQAKNMYYALKECEYFLRQDVVMLTAYEAGNKNTLGKVVEILKKANPSL